MNSYMKMNDVFNNKFCESMLSVNPDCVKEEWNDGVTPHDHIVHAVKSHDDLVSRISELEGFLHHFCDNSHNVDVGGGDYTATTCEAKEMAEKLDRRVYD